MSSPAPCAAEELWEPNASTMPLLRFVPKGPRFCHRPPSCSPRAAQDPRVSAENYPEKEQRELSHLCVCHRNAKEASNAFACGKVLSVV